MDCLSTFCFGGRAGLGAASALALKRDAWPRLSGSHCCYRNPLLRLGGFFLGLSHTPHPQVCYTTSSTSAALHYNILSQVSAAGNN